MGEEFKWLFPKNMIHQKKLHPFSNENVIFTKNSVELQLFSINIHQNWKQIDQNMHLKHYTRL